MKTLFVSLFALFLSASSMAVVEGIRKPRLRPTMSCQSIDVTFAPYYKIWVKQAYEGRTEFPVRITIREDLAGTQETSEDFEAKGTLSKTKMNLKLDNGARLTGNKMANGMWKAEYKDGSEREELSCRILIPR